MAKPPVQHRDIKTAEQLKRKLVPQAKLRAKLLKTFVVSFTRTDKRGGRK